MCALLTNVPSGHALNPVGWQFVDALARDTVAPMAMGKRGSPQEVDAVLEQMLGHTKVTNIKMPTVSCRAFCSGFPLSHSASQACMRRLVRLLADGLAAEHDSSAHRIVFLAAHQPEIHRDAIRRMFVHKGAHT